MAYEDRRVVADPDTAPADTTVVSDEPAAVVERRPTTRTVVTDDPVGNSYAASNLISTIVWSIVVLVLLIVGLWALHVYAGLF